MHTPEPHDHAERPAAAAPSQRRSAPADGALPIDGLEPVPHLERKAAALLLFTLLLIVGSVLYLLYARGVFEPTQSLVLTAENSEGVSIGMDMTFSGFPIGKVDKIELAKSDWVRSFEGKSLNDPGEDGWAVKKDRGEFDQFAGATITPRAVVKAVHGALRYFDKHRAQLLGLAEDEQ